MAAGERARAARIVHQVIDSGRSVDTLIRVDDSGFVRALSFETLRWHHRLEAIALRLLQRRPRNRDIIILRLIEIGLAQLIYLDVAGHAAINETVSAANALKQGRARGMINAVLRRFQRERDAIDQSLAEDAAARHGFPHWLAEAVARDWPEASEAILAASNERAPMTLRLNAARVSSDQYLDQLKAEGIGAKAAAGFPAAVILDEPVDVTALPGFADGLVSVQDLAAQQAAELLALDHPPDQPIRVLDACAAPGGKTGHVAEKLSNGDSLIALDESAKRQELTRANLQRLGLDTEIKLDIQSGDAARPDDWWDGQPFDRILLDAPCSATGVIRRHPDIKIHRRQSDISQLNHTQSALLEALWPLLKPGGRMIYATCSILRDENERRVLAFLEQHEDARLIDLDVAWGRARPAGRQVLPGDDDMDGFYYAGLLKQ
ncbi:MAG: 16S rRNA (cytosine(967)-C(5))-methyltransferase RsmB [Gammaproteobacteria bacterium]